MAGEEPPYLTVGTDVSAKYKGAFCEAKIKKVIRSVKCKVTFKNNVGSAVVTDDLVRGTLRVGAHVEAKHPEKTQYMEAVINKLHDYSQYTVVFDDGDETTLRRTSLCLKSGRHFAESETLDQLPLTHPEHFGTPVMGSKGRKRRSLNRTLPGGDGSSDEEPSVKKKEAKSKEPEPDMGKVVCVELGDKKKQKDNWVPGLVVSPNAQDSIRVKGKDEYMIKSFKDGKYHVVDKKDTREFTRDIGTKVDGGTLKTAVEKALQYVERDELPPHWDRDVLFGVDNSSNDDNSDQDTESDSSDDEPSEEKDRFVAQLYKFMDDRGTPINKAPTVSNKDLNLYKLFKVVQKLGGYNRATNQMQWKAVYTKMGLPSYNTSSSHQIKQAYKKYLHSFEEFYRKLGCTMSTSTRSSRVRHRSSRNFLMTRDRDREFKAVGRKAAKQSIKKEKDEEKPKTKESDDEGKSEDREKSTLAVELDCSDDTENKSCPDDSFPSGESSKSNLADKKSKASKEGRENIVVDKEDSDVDDDKLEKDERSRSKGKIDDGKSDSPSPKRRGRKKLSRKADLEEEDKGQASDDEPDKPCTEVDTSIGDRVKVKYGRGRQQKIYEAKVLKLDEEEGDRIFFVHYTGWNVRYDEWVKRHRVVENLTQRTIGKRTRLTSGIKSSSKPPAKRGRPQGSTSAAKSQLSNAGGKKTGGPSRPRSTRSDRSSLAESPFVNGLEPKKRGRKISGPQAATSDVSDSDSGESDAGSLGRRTSKRLSKHDTSTEDLDTSIEEEPEKDEGPGYDDDDLGPGRAYESLEDADVDDRRGRTKPIKKSSPIKTRVDGSDDEGIHGHSDDDMRKVTDMKPARRSRGRPSKNHTAEVKEELKGGAGKDNRKMKTKKTTEDEVGDDEDLDDMNGKTVSDILERIGLDKDDDDDDDDLALPMKPPCSLDDWKENRLFATSDHQYSDPTKDLDDLKMPSTGPDSPKEGEHIEVVIKQAADENDAMLDRVVAVIANQSGSSDAIAISFPSEMGVIIAKEDDGDLDGMAEVEAPKLAAETEIDEPMPNLEKEMPPNLLLDAIPTLEMETAMFEPVDEATPVENDDEKALSIVESPPKEEIYVVIGELTAPAIIHEVPVMSPVCECNETSQDGIGVVGKTVDVNGLESTSVDVNELACKDSELVGDTSDMLKKEEEQMTNAAEMQCTYDRTADVGYQPPLPVVESVTNDAIECPESIPEAKIEDIEPHPSESTDHDVDGSTPEALAPGMTLNDQAATSDTSVDTQERDAREVFEPENNSLTAIPEVAGVLPDPQKSSVPLVTESGQSSSWNEDIAVADQVQKTDTEARIPNECENTIEEEEEPCISTATIEALTAPPTSELPVDSSHCKGSKKDRRRQKGKRLDKRRSMDVVEYSSDETSVEDEPRAKKKKSRDERTDSRVRESQSKGESRPKKSREKRSKSSKRGDSDRDDSKTLKKKGASWKARRKECKKKKESSEKEARSHKVGDERMDSDDVSSQSSDGSLQRKSKKSKKHSKAGDKGRDSATEGQSERRKYLSSKRSKASSESGSPSEGHTSDDGHWETSAKKIRKEERSKRDKKRKDRSKKKSNSGDDSDSSIGRIILSPEMTVVNIEQQKASEVGDAQASLFLMCEERVPASPLAVEDVAPTFPSEERPPCASKDASSSLLIPEVSSAASLSPVMMSCTSVPVLSFELTVTPKVKAEPQPSATTSTTLLDNTPPTTPESAELDNSPPPCRERGITLVSPSHDASDSTTSGSKSNQGCCQDDYTPSTGTSFERLLTSHKFLQPDTVETGQVTTVLPKRSKPESDDQTSKKKNKKSHKKQGSLEPKPSSVPVIAATPVGTRQRQNSSKTLKGSDNEERPALPLDHTATLGQSSTSPSGTHPANLGVSVDTRGIGTPPRPSRFNFYVELDDYSDGAERIAILQEKLTELRKTYMALKAEVACIDRRRKKLKRKEKEVSPAASGASSAAVECS